MKRYFFILIGYITAALIVNFENQWFIVPPVLITMLILDAQVFRIFLKWKFITFLGVLVFGLPLFIGSKDASFLRIPYSSSVFEMSLVMFHRSIIILMSIKIFTNRIPLVQISKSIQNTRLKKFGQVFSISMDTLPEINSITKNSLQEFRRKPRSKNIISEVFDSLVRLFVRILYFAEDYHTKNGK